MMTNVDDRRSVPRRRTLKAAKIVYGDYRFVLDCVMRDVNKTGARVRCPHAAEAPDEFHLYDMGESQMWKAEVAWRKGLEIGVHFIGEPVSIHTATDPRLARFKFL